MMRGETIRTGAPEVCPTCLWRPEFEVYSSGGGYYIGTYCQCGPYTRESHYYRSAEDAQDDLDNGTVRWRDIDDRKQLYRTIVISAEVIIPSHLANDAVLGDHTIKCVLSDNCGDDYESCLPAKMTIFHAREQD
jgi:hypothetical protein